MTNTSSNKLDFVWQSIDSAPKDGTPILCYTPNPFGFGFADAKLIDVLWWEADSWQYASKPVVFQPTHWMPVPKPPEPKKDAPQGYARAAQWYRKAAEKGLAQAQFKLGVLYAIGQGVQQDYEQAAQWYRMAAEQGDAMAQFSLGVLYDAGCGVPQDYAQAALWYRKAADQGNSWAQYNLGNLYANSLGVPRNPVIACALWLVAVPSSTFVKAKRGSLEKQMTPAEITAAQALAVELAKPGNFTKALDAHLAQGA